MSTDTGFSFIHHRIATSPLPPPASALYEYLLAGNGVFLRAQRQGLSACIPVAPAEIRGLPSVEPYTSLHAPRIPQPIMETILLESITAWGNTTGPKEALFHCTYEPEAQWTLTIPDQIRTYDSVRCADPFTHSYNSCLVEIHSHHEMPPLFSSIDDMDETGFRLFGVIGNFGRRPQILFRVGIYGYFATIPARYVAHLPPVLQDAFANTQG
jgi:PRTRC genetic system protein A